MILVGCLCREKAAIEFAAMQGKNREFFKKSGEKQV